RASAGVVRTKARPRPTVARGTTSPVTTRSGREKRRRRNKLPSRFLNPVRVGLDLGALHPHQAAAPLENAGASRFRIASLGAGNHAWVARKIAATKCLRSRRNVWPTLRRRALANQDSQ